MSQHDGTNLNYAPFFVIACEGKVYKIKYMPHVFSKYLELSWSPLVSISQILICPHFNCLMFIIFSSELFIGLKPRSYTRINTLKFKIYASMFFHYFSVRYGEKEIYRKFHGIS